MGEQVVLDRLFYYGWQGKFWGISEAGKNELKKSDFGKCLNKDKSFNRMREQLENSGKTSKKIHDWVSYTEAEMREIFEVACLSIFDSARLNAKQTRNLVCAPTSPVPTGAVDCQLNNGVIKKLLENVQIGLWSEN